MDFKQNRPTGIERPGRTCHPMSSTWWSIWLAFKNIITSGQWDAKHNEGACAISNYSAATSRYKSNCKTEAYMLATVANWLESFGSNTQVTDVVQYFRYHVKLLNRVGVTISGIFRLNETRGAGRHVWPGQLWLQQLWSCKHCCTERQFVDAETVGAMQCTASAQQHNGFMHALQACFLKAEINSWHQCRISHHMLQCQQECRCGKWAHWQHCERAAPARALQKECKEDTPSPCARKMSSLACAMDSTER